MKILKKEYYVQDGEKIKINEFGEVYGDNGRLGKIDEFGKFHSSDYGQGSAKVDEYGYIIDGNGNTIGKIDGIHNNKIIIDKDNSSSSDDSSKGGASFASVILLLFKLMFNWKFLVVAWVLGMIICIATGEAPWD